MNKSEWYIRKIKDKAKMKLRIEAKRENFGNRRYYAPEIVINMISEMLRNNVPFSVGRMGMGELTWLIKAEQEDSIGKELFSRPYKEGEWATDEHNRRQFVEITRKGYANIDILVNWYKPDLEEDILIQKYAKKEIILTGMEILAPFIRERPWSKFLEGKKVLVISPFTEEIIHQYINRGKIYENKDVLPEFELKVYRAIWITDYINKNHCTFKEVFDKYIEDIFNIDFDVALISCSAPSFAIAAEIKKRGRTGIQMGGDLQILFGIKGKRWDKMPLVNCLYNEYWIRPYSDSKPSNMDVMDDSCYW